MQRLTITVDVDLLDEIDRLVQVRGYSSRSEAIRDSLRAAFATDEPAKSGSASMAYGVLSYVFKHDLRDLSKRLTEHQHDHHGMSVSTLHVHINHDDCLEVAILKGQAGDLQNYSDAIGTQRGVRYSRLHLIPDKG